MNIEFVTYEQALALKELGFDEPCLASYETAFGRDIDFELGYIINGPKNYVLSPLKQQVFRWFRENHNWIGGVRMLSGGSNYLVGEFYKDEDNSFMRFRGTYEEIENDCINELIDRIKEQNNG
jgi:hypothetical protein